MMYKTVFLEISGRCNAKCRWCVTGIENRCHPDEMPMMKKNCMSLAKVKEIITHLESREMVDKDTVYFFYNWGEPFLNPELFDILAYMYERKLRYGLSTNASVPWKLKRDIPNDFFADMVHFRISYCGFSQESYDRIHGFNFEKIKANTKEIIRNARKYGANYIEIHYHVYQFNEGDEFIRAKEFCKKLNVCFFPIYAYFNDYNRGIGYLNNTLPIEEYKAASKELYLFYVDGVLKKRPANYPCPQFDKLTIDENGDLLPCCAAIHEKLTNIVERTPAEIEEWRHNVRSCIECRNTGLDYWVHNPAMPYNLNEKICLTKTLQNSKSRKYTLWGCGKIGEKVYNKINKLGLKIIYCIDKNISEGGVWHDLPVKQPEEVHRKTTNEFVIIATDKYRMEITSILTQKDFSEYIDFAYYGDFFDALEQVND